MKIELSYQTQDLPPPYAFAATFQIDTSHKGVEMTFQLMYLNREDLSSDEITAEGFTGDDDFNWNGSLGLNWVPAINSFKTMKYQSEPLNESYLHVVIDGVESGYPVDSQEVIIQELIQAVFESGKKEQPLQLQLCDENMVMSNLTWEFGQMKFLVDQRESDWEASRYLMQLCYSLEFEEDSIFDQPKAGSINFQNTGEWLQVNDTQTVHQLTQLITRLKGA